MRNGYIKRNIHFLQLYFICMSFDFIDVTVAFSPQARLKILILETKWPFPCTAHTLNSTHTRAHGPRVVSTRAKISVGTGLISSLLMGSTFAHAHLTYVYFKANYIFMFYTLFIIKYMLTKLLNIIC